MNQENLSLIIASFVFFVWFGYYAYLSWINPKKFIHMSEKSRWFYGDSESIKKWINSYVFLLLARLCLTFSAGILMIIFGTTLFKVIA